MSRRVSLRIKLGVGVGLLLVVSLGVGGVLWRTAHRGAAKVNQVIALSRFMEDLQALDPALVKLTAVVELVSHGDGAFRDDLARGLRSVDDLLARLGRQASALSAAPWGLLKHLEQEWTLGRRAIVEFQQMPPDASVVRQADLLGAVRTHVGNMQEAGTALHQACTKTLQQDASAVAVWPRRVSVRSALLVLGVVGLALLISLPWAMAVRRLSRQLRQAAERLARGEFTYHLERLSNDEFGELADAVNAATDSLRRAQGEPTTLIRQQHQLEDRDRQLAALQDRLRHVERAHEAAQSDAKQLRQALEDKTRELVSLQHALTSLEGEQGRLQAGLAHQQGGLSQTQQALASTQDALSSTQSELQWAQQTIVQLTTARDALQADSAAARKESEQVRTALQTQAQAQQQESAQTQTRLTTAQASLAALQSEWQQTQAEAQELRRALTEKTEALTQAQQAAAQLTSRCDTLQAKLEKQQKEPQQAEASLKAVKEELAASQKEVQKLTAALTEKTQALTETQQNVSKLQGRLGKQQAELTRRQEEVTKLQASLSTTKSVS